MLLLFLGEILSEEEGVVVNGGFMLPREKFSLPQLFVISCLIWECPLT